MPIYFVEEFERRLQTLLPVERKVFNRMIRARTTREIAQELDLNVKAVQVHRRRIIDAFGTGNVVELIDLARRAKLPTIDEPEH